MNLHPLVILTHIENATAGAITRRAPRKHWPMGLLAAICLLAMLAVIAGLAQ